MNAHTDNLFSRSSFAQKRLRERLGSQLDQHKLFAAIDADPALAGAGVVYIDASFNLITGSAAGGSISSVAVGIYEEIE